MSNSYLRMILNHYKSLSGAFSYENSALGKKKMQIHISGKIKKSFVIFWLLFSSVFVFFNLLRYNIWIVLLLTIISIIATLLTSRKIHMELEHKPINLDLYKRELPSKLKPAHVRMLLNDGLVDETSLCATWIDLIDRGYINLRRENEELIFSRTDKEEKELLEFEKFLIYWFIDKYGNRKEINSKQINYCLNNKMYNEKPYQLFDYFQNRVWISFPLEKFYNVKENMALKKTICMVIAAYGFLNCIRILGLPLIIYGIGCSMFATPYMYLNEFGVEEKDHWVDFKKYLIDFSNFKEKTTEMISIWDFYLTYSMVLDINSKLSEEIKNIFKDDIYNDYFENNKDVNIEKTNKTLSEKYIIPEDVKKSLGNDISKELKKYNFDI